MMTNGYIWWQRVSSSIALFQEITDRLRYQESIVLIMPPQIPWESDFKSAMQTELAPLSADRSLQILEDQPAKAPEDLVLEQLCPRAVRDAYWPGQNKIEYLATSDIPNLAQYNVWVRGIQSSARLAKWQKLVRAYETHQGKAPQHAAFLLESTIPPSRTAANEVHYHVKECDTYSFCLELADKLPVPTFLQRYAAELARALAQENPQVCEALFSLDDLLLTNPSEAAARAQRHCPTFRITDENLYIALWKIQLMFCFPVLERFRFDFVEQHATALLPELPISNSAGEEITEVTELELGSLYYLCNKNKKITDSKTLAKLDLCRTLRNLLAHGNCLEYDQVVQLHREIAT